MVKCTQGVQFFKFIEIDQAEINKIHMSNIIKIEQSQISDGKIASKGKMLLAAK